MADQIIQGQTTQIAGSPVTQQNTQPNIHFSVKVIVAVLFILVYLVYLVLVLAFFAPFYSQDFFIFTILFGIAAFTSVVYLCRRLAVAMQWSVFVLTAVGIIIGLAYLFLTVMLVLFISTGEVNM